MLRTILVLGLLTGILLAMGCQSEEDSPELAGTPLIATNHLPEKSGGFTLTSSADKQTPDEFRSYLGEAGAETAAAFRSVGLVTGSYGNEQSGDQLSVEIAQFERQIEAFGYYARLRPSGVDTLTLGVEGYYEGNSLYFTQDMFAVTLSVISASDDVQSVLLPVAVTISAMIENNPPLPEEFTTFPDSGRVQPSNRYHPGPYLGIPGLADVYSSLYVIEGDSLTLFAAMDKLGTKFLAVAKATGTLETAAPKVLAYGFDEEYGISFVDEDEGSCLAGLKSAWLVGAAGYDPTRHEEFLAAWIESWDGSFQSR